jgi:tetratricopeptide (TPR) repeat protein
VLSPRVIDDRFATEVEVALATVAGSDATAVEKTEMLVEIAMGLQKRPRAAAQIEGALVLYRKAVETCPAAEPLLRARTLARMATALRTLPGDACAPLEAALQALDDAAPALAALGAAEEVAELEMNRGLVLQALAGAGRARIQDAIAAYQRAVRVFDRHRFPKEFAILHNNLATAFLAVAPGGERSKMSEALAVSSFEEGLRGVNLIDHPVEYAMLQNNLGNALQSVTSAHTLDNSLRALEAYDEALRVRTRGEMPTEYANTIANRATCLWGLPDDPADPAAGNRENLRRARRLLGEALEIFMEHGESVKAAAVREALEAIGAELAAADPADPADIADPENPENPADPENIAEEPA